LDRATHEHERISGPLCALWFAVFSLPFFLWAPDRPSKHLPVKEAIRRGLTSVARTVKSLGHYRNVAAYLGVRMIYNDGLNVMLSFGGVYAAGVFHWGVVESALYGILLSIFAALGGLFGGRLADRIGTKRALQLSVGGTILAALLSLGFAPDRLFFVISYAAGTPVAALPVFRTAPELFYIATVMVIAVCLVATYANSRAMMARIAPESRMTEFFGLYALSGEATAFIAPLAVAVATQISGSQQWGMAAIVAFLAIGFAGLAFVREERAAAV
jgi:UMF1 family MFS transporter